GARESLALVLLQISADKEARFTADSAAVEHSAAIAATLAQFVTELERHDKFTGLQDVPRDRTHRCKLNRLERDIERCISGSARRDLEGAVTLKFLDDCVGQQRFNVGREVLAARHGNRERLDVLEVARLDRTKRIARAAGQYQHKHRQQKEGTRPT